MGIKLTKEKFTENDLKYLSDFYNWNYEKDKDISKKAEILYINKYKKIYGLTSGQRRSIRDRYKKGFMPDQISRLLKLPFNNVDDYLIYYLQKRLQGFKKLCKGCNLWKMYNEEEFGYSGRLDKDKKRILRGRCIKCYNIQQSEYRGKNGYFNRKRNLKISIKGKINRIVTGKRIKY